MASAWAVAWRSPGSVSVDRAAWETRNDRGDLALTNLSRLGAGLPRYAQTYFRAEMMVAEFGRAGRGQGPCYVPPRWRCPAWSRVRHHDSTLGAFIAPIPAIPRGSHSCHRSACPERLSRMGEPALLPQVRKPASAKLSMRVSSSSASLSRVRPSESTCRRSNSAARLLCTMPRVKCSRQ